MDAVTPPDTTGTIELDVVTAPAITISSTVHTVSDSTVTNASEFGSFEQSYDESNETSAIVLNVHLLLNDGTLEGEVIDTIANDELDKLPITLNAAML